MLRSSSKSGGKTSRHSTGPSLPGSFVEVTAGSNVVITMRMPQSSKLAESNMLFRDIYVKDCATRQGSECLSDSVEGVTGKRKAGWKLRTFVFTDTSIGNVFTVWSSPSLIERQGEIEEGPADTIAGRVKRLRSILVRVRHGKIRGEHEEPITPGMERNWFMPHMDERRERFRNSRVDLSS